MVQLKAIIFLCTGLLIGVFSARVIDLDSTVLMILVSVGVGVSSRFSKMWVCCFLFAGVLLGQARALPVSEGHAFLTALEGQKISVEGDVFVDPVYHESGQYQFNLQKLEVNGRAIDAVLRVRSYTNDIARGDRVEVSGKLRDGFAYWQGSMYYAQTKKLSADNSLISNFRRTFIANIYSAMPDPEASLGLGFLIGIRSLLPDNLVDQLSVTGLTHVVAVSGYNLTILANGSKRLFEKRSRFQALAFSLGFIFVFVTITGMSPSILRATIVSGLSLGAWYYGRKVGALALLLFSTAISAYINPSYAWFDVGWYLSLAAFFGVLVIAPLVQARIYKNREPKFIESILIETSSAQITTMPIVMLVFGKVSVVALLANALILPLIPLAMLLTFLAGIAGFVHWSLGALLALPGYWLIQFMTGVIEALSRFDWALVEINIQAAGLIFLYILIGFAWFLLHRKVAVHEPIAAE